MPLGELASRQKPGPTWIHDERARQWYSASPLRFTLELLGPDLLIKRAKVTFFPADSRVEVLQR